MTVRAGDTYTGKPCGRGHGGLRYSRSRACVQCMKDAAEKQRERRKKKNAIKNNTPEKRKAAKPGASFRQYPDTASQQEKIFKHPGARVKAMQPRPANCGGVETVEQFIARGGEIRQVPFGISSLAEVGCDD